LIDTTLDAGPKPLAGPHPGRLKVDALAQTDADVAAWLTTVDAFHASYNELIAGWLQEFEALRRYIERGGFLLASAGCSSTAPTPTPRSSGRRTPRRPPTRVDVELVVIRARPAPDAVDVPGAFSKDGRVPGVETAIHSGS